MKKQNAITLVSLVIYIIVMLMMIGVMSSISLNFYKNTVALDKDTKDIINFNDFNQYFIKEIKTVNNKIDKIASDGTYILFTTGNCFSLKDNSIFFNNVEISKGVKNVNFSYAKDSEENDIPDVVVVYIEYNTYSKTMKYKLEEIY